MLYANDEIFNTSYDAKLDKLVNKKKSSSKKHKFIAVIVALFAICSLLNCVLVFTFMQLLKTV